MWPVSRILSIDFTGSNGNDVQVTSGVPVGAVPITTASSTQYAYVAGSYNSSDNGTTYTFQSLTVEPGATDTLGPLDTLVLTNGPLVIAPGAFFSGNGTIDGSVFNEGLLRIPIVKLNEASSFQGGYVAVISGSVSAPAIDLGGGGMFGFYGGGDGGGGDTITTPAVTNSAVVGFNANLEVTGSFTQTSSGLLRMFIGGNQKGVTYSHLDVGQQVTLSGGLELVLEPDLLGFVPQDGETFDLIDSPAGISLSDFAYTNFITAAGASYLPSLTFTPFNSGIEDDPDQLDSIQQTVFTYALVDNGTELQATYVGPEPVPEPSTWVLIIGGAALLPRLGRRAGRKG